MAKGIKPHSRGKLGLSATYQVLYKQKVCLFLEKKTDQPHCVNVWVLILQVLRCSAYSQEVESFLLDPYRKTYT